MAKQTIVKFNRPFYRQGALRFECTGCGECCTAGGDYFVYVTPQEIEKIGGFLALSSAWFKRCYLQRLPEEGWVLAVNGDETCVYP